MTNRVLSLREAQCIRELRVSKNDCGQRDHYRKDNFMICLGILTVDIIIPIDPFKAVSNICGTNSLLWLGD